MDFNINGEIIADVPVWSNGGYCNRGGDSFSIFLKEGDKIYFSAHTSSSAATASERYAESYCYPMF